MQNATDPGRRQGQDPTPVAALGRPPRTVSHASAVNAANDIASTNSTSSRFIGTNQRSWMRPGLVSSNPPESISARQHSTSRMPATAPITTTTITPTPASVTVPDAPAVQSSHPSSTRSVPSYRFLSHAPELLPENAGSLDPNREEQREGVSAAGLEPARVNDKVPEEQGDTSHRAEAGFAEPTATFEDEIEVVDLTASQPDQNAHGPPEQETGVRVDLHSTHEPAAVAEINAAIHADTSPPPAPITIDPKAPMFPAVSHAISSDETESLRRRADTHSNSTDIPVSAPAQDRSAPAATFFRPPSTQLLTPATSPLVQHNDQLQRKRPAIDVSDLQHPHARLRTESLQASPLTRHFPSSTTSIQSPSQDQITQFQPRTFVVPPQTAHRQNVPQQSSFTGLTQSQQPIHGGSSSRTPSHPVAPHLYRAGNAGQALPLPVRGQSYLLSFDTTIAEMAVRVDLSDRPQLRIPWIRDACQNNDLFFLLLNQLLCTWHFSKALLVQFGIDTICDGGFRILELLFASNNELPNELVAFLAGWPNSTYSLNANAELNQWVAKISQFLPHLSLQWETFRTECINRHCPPTAREITDAFQCPPSTVLPRAIFTSLARQIEPGASSDFHNDAYELFRLNQSEYLTALVRQRLNHSLEADYATFSTQYKHLLQRHWFKLGGIVVPKSGQPSLSCSGATTTTLLQPHFIVPSQRQIPHLPTERRDTTQLNQDLLNSVAIGGGVPTHQVSISRNVSAPRVRSPVDTGNGNGNGNRNTQNNVQTSPVLQSTMNSMGPIQSDFARNNFQPVPSGASPKPVISHNPETNAQPSRTQIFRQNAISYPVQPLLPDLNNLPPFLTNPIPEQEALHLAHLRQPHTDVKDVKPGEPPRLYQFIQSCVLGPYQFKPEVGFFRLCFGLSPDLVRRKADIIQPLVSSFKLPKRLFTTKSLLFNLRCTQLGSGEELPDEPDWAALPTQYPQHIFISFNDEHLEIRRKRQFRKDLPIDVTPFVRSGENTVNVSVHGEKSEEGKRFAIAVEVVRLRDHFQAFKMPTKIPAMDSLNSITSTMQPATDGDDDDMQLVTDSIVLSITDPFLSSMFTIPVRGKKCKHRECFDLETFLQSRVSDNKDALTSVYEWRCPTCGKDARPSSLVIDGFLQEVRDQLAGAGNTEARAIVVKDDGSWTVRQEVDREGGRTASRDESGQIGRDGKNSEGRSATATDQAADIPPAQAGVAAAAASAKAQDAPSRVLEIIELDDD